ncbi:MAG: hypothetical protein JNM84_21200 [Planctomycetes bacterium]|nr:hypothetical protein [Planctomycetota bacterium]
MLGSVRFDPGETYTLHYELQLRPLVLRLRSADGTPLPVGTKVVVREGSMEHELRCEEAGVVRCDPGPTTPFSLEVNGVRSPSEGLLEPPAGTQTSELVVELAR